MIRFSARRPSRLFRLVAAAAMFAIPAASPLAALAHDVPGDPSHAHGPSAAKPVSMEQVSKEMADGALAWWATLTPEQQKKAMYAFTDDERLNWHFIPKARNGLPIKEMTPAQQKMAWAFLATGLSTKGFIKVQQIGSLEAFLKEIEPGPPKTPERDPEKYFFTIFGTPDANGTWGWRFEGHHLSVNFTVAGGKAVTGLPTFLGDNPGEIREGPRKGLRVLAAEEDLGRKLVQSLTDEQKKKAIFSAEAPKDIISMVEKKVDVAKVTGDKLGIPASELTPDQRDGLLTLIEEYANRHRNELAQQELRKIHVAGFDKVYFGWAGGVNPREPHYYRIHGPSFLIEYDNTQNNANHIHTVWRDPANDFGENALKQHYATDPHHAEKK